MPPRARFVLQDLDPALVPHPFDTPSTRSRPNKRPHSPTVGSLDIPAKRRIKGEEGNRTPRVKSPLSGSTNSARFAPAYFHALLQGPDSPAKRLDFGSDASEKTVCDAPHSSGGGSETPRRSPKRTTTVRVRRSPRLSARTPSPSTRKLGSVAHGQIGADVHAAATTRVNAIAPILIAREVIPPDRQSVHYPGFDVYQDPHVMLPTVHDTMRAANEASSDRSSLDKDYDKENTAPRRKLLKMSTTPTTPPSETAWLMALSPSLAKSSVKKRVPPSPRPKHVQDYLALPLSTPKTRTLHPVISPSATLVGVTPIRTPLGKEERRLMRRALEEEVDTVDCED